ncbi:MAG: hypothetical protein F2817_06665 [Actinobacteria bacterium]|nr:hypothetical protein [Actinomycetota bacterium]
MSCSYEDDGAGGYGFVCRRDHGRQPPRDHLVGCDTCGRTQTAPTATAAVDAATAAGWLVSDERDLCAPCLAAAAPRESSTGWAPPG